MPTIGDIKIRIGMNLKPLEASLKRAEYKLQRSGRKLAEIGSRLTATLSVPLLGIGAASIQVAGELEGLKKGLETMMGSAEAAKNEIALLRKEALKPGLNFEQALKGSVRLQAVQIDAEIARRAISGFGNALALVGGTGEQLDGVTLALSQIAAKGKVSAEEINQIAERVPQIRQILKGAFGTADTEEIQKLGIGFDEFITKAIVELEKLPRAQAGIKTSIENTKLALQEAAELIGQKVFPVFERISKVVLKAVTAFSKLPAPLQDNIVKFALFSAVLGPVISVLGSVKLAYGTLIGSVGRGVGVLKTFFLTKRKGIPIGAALVKVMRLLAVSTLSLVNPSGLLQKATIALTASKTKLIAVVSGLGSKLLFLYKNPIQAAKKGLLALKVAITGITLPFSLVVGAIAAFGVAVVANIGPARQKFVSFTNTVIDLYNNVTPIRAAVEAIGATFKTLYSIGKATLKTLLTGFKTLGRAMVAVLKGDFDKLKGILQSGFSDFSNTAAQSGKEIGEAWNNAYTNTFDQREPLDLITEKDVDNAIKRAGKAVKGIQEKLFGVEKVEDSILPNLSDLSQRTFTRKPKATTANTTTESVEKHTISRIFKSEAADLVPTSLLPEGLQEHTEKLEEFANRVDNIAEAYQRLRETLTPVQEAFVSIGEGIGNSLDQAATSFRDFARNALKSIGDVIGGLIKKGVAAAIANAFVANPLLGLAIGPVIGGLASGIFKSVLGKIAPPKLAKGGLAYGETLAVVGDNPNAQADPEVIAPLSKLKDILKNSFPMEGFQAPSFKMETPTITNDFKALLQPQQVKVHGTFRVAGSDLRLILERENQHRQRYGIG